MFRDEYTDFLFGYYETVFKRKTYFKYENSKKIIVGEIGANLVADNHILLKSIKQIEKLRKKLLSQYIKFFEDIKNDEKRLTGVIEDIEAHSKKLLSETTSYSKVEMIEAINHIIELFKEELKDGYTLITLNSLNFIKYAILETDDSIKLDLFNPIEIVTPKHNDIFTKDFINISLFSEEYNLFNAKIIYEFVELLKNKIDLDELIKYIEMNMVVPDFRLNEKCSYNIYLIYKQHLFVFKNEDVDIFISETEKEKITYGDITNELAETICTYIEFSNHFIQNKKIKVKIELF